MTALEQKLVGVGFLELFGYGDRALESIWRDAGANALRALALDDRGDALARFLAAEILFAKQSGPANDDERRALATVYAAALARQFGGAANAWVFPDGTLGRAGEHVVELGGMAIPALHSLLDDETAVGYEGSKEATIGNAYRFRVKDLAAMLVAKIMKRPFRANEDAHARDAAIARLKDAR